MTNNMEKISFRNGMNITLEHFGTKQISLWEKNGHKRLYVKREDGQKTHGYLDMNVMKFYEAPGKEWEYFGNDVIAAIQNINI